MAERKPVVLVSGQLKELPAGDTLPSQAPAAHTHSATSITNSPAGNVAATNVQGAINELDTEKLPKSGGTMTGALTLPANGLVVGSNQIVASGNAVFFGPGGFGYATGIGAGGSVTQPTSKDTTVTLNKICGIVTTHNQSMTGGDVKLFDVINSFALTSTVAVVGIDLSTPFSWEYAAMARVVGGGCITVALEKISGSVSRTDSVVIKFTLFHVSST